MVENEDFSHCSSIYWKDAFLAGGQGSVIATWLQSECPLPTAGNSAFSPTPPHCLASFKICGSQQRLV